MNALTGAWALARLVIRRDRVLLGVWATMAVAIPLANAASLTALLPTSQARQGFVVDSAANPVVNGMLGPILSPSIEAIVAWRSNVHVLLVVALASLLLVIRHTRAEEEAGRLELLEANPVGRHAGLTAALGVAFTANLVVALLLTLALVAVAGYPVAGSLAFALSFAATGCCFAAIAGTLAQLVPTAAAARNHSIGVLAVSFLPVMAADGGTPSRAIWLSPVGWTRAVRAYAGEQWAVLLLPVVVATVLTATAHVLSARRDVGAGVLADRTRGMGPAHAAPALRTPLALAWRLHRSQLVGWGIGLGVFSVALGSQATSFDQLFADLTIIADWLSATGAATLGEAFLTMLAFDLRLIVACIAVVTVLRMRTEEAGGRVDPLLAGPTSRWGWMRSHLVVAFAGPSAVLVGLGLGAGLAYGLAAGRPDAVVAQVAAATLFLPAAWFVTAVAVASYGLRPRAAAAVSWGLMVAFVVPVLLWEVRAIDRSVFLLSPFAYSHPTVDAGVVAPAVFTVLAGLLTAVGAAAFLRRDIGG